MSQSGEKCPICGSATSVFREGTTTPEAFFRRSAGYQISAGEGKEWLPVRKCQTCGHGYSPLFLTQDVIARWYAEAAPDENFLVDTEPRRRTARRVLQRIHGLLPGKRGRLLDVGSGPGVFLTEAVKDNWQVAGLEPAAWAGRHARDILGITTIQEGDTRELAHFSPEGFDVVVAFDVIEHVVSPQELVESVGRVLKPGGLFVLTTPWFGSLVSRLMGKRWYCIFPAHLHYFTRQSLTQVLQGAGFDVVSVRRHTRYLGWKYVWARLRAQLGIGSDVPVQPSRLALPMNLGDEFEVYARKA